MGHRPHDLHPAGRLPGRRAALRAGGQRGQPARGGRMGGGGGGERRLPGARLLSQRARGARDDQIAPASSAWLHDLLALFRAWPQLAIVGMNTYRLCKHAEPTNRFGFTSWEPDPRTGVKWSFVQNVDFAPLVVRSSAWAALGGLEESFSRPGDCGIWGDWELCTRAWLDGWQVGFLHLDGRSGDGHAGGTHTASNAERCWGRQQYTASACFGKRYEVAAFQEELCGRVWRLNVDSFRLPEGAECPYNTRDTRYGNCSRPAI
ncbi:hypothetical protein Agub_g8261 [Astrephomene gubernaculifera]|uniref:Uncharacterized protein n=1 Tax=Astrephomene gubernaculifera TaxID=47775 RepID=A0AAD3DRD0_9CHLO|nr:hypothetical protein Agub_g8261 [Astrephomene gubernaculifera]